MIAYARRPINYVLESIFSINITMSPSRVWNYFTRSAEHQQLFKFLMDQLCKKLEKLSVDKKRNNGYYCFDIACTYMSTDIGYTQKV